MRLQRSRAVSDGCPAPDMLIAAGEGVLPESIEHAVQLHLASCPRCAMVRRELAASPLAEPTLEEMTRVRRRIKAGTGRAKRPGMRYAAFAASVAIVLTLPFGWEQEKPVMPLPEKPASTRVPATIRAAARPCPPVAKAPFRLPLATAVVMRGVSGADEHRYLRQLGSALAPYRADDFPNASARLERLATLYPRRVEPVFYLGVARLISGDVARAVEALESAKRIGSAEVDDDIARYLAAARQAGACNVERQ